MSVYLGSRTPIRVESTVWDTEKTIHHWYTLRFLKDKSHEFVGELGMNAGYLIIGDEHAIARCQYSISDGLEPVLYFFRILDVFGAIICCECKTVVSVRVVSVFFDSIESKQISSFVEKLCCITVPSST